MIYHLFKAYFYHHTPSQINKVLANAENTNTSLKQHYFWLRNKKQHIYNSTKENLTCVIYEQIFDKYYTNNRKYFSRDICLAVNLLKLRESNKLIIHDSHDLFGKPMLFWLLLSMKSKKFLNNTSYIAFGVPEHCKTSNNIVYNFLLARKKLVLNLFDKIITLTNDDKKKLVKWYNLSNVIVSGYPFVGEPDYFRKLAQKSNDVDNKVTIMVAHSANPHNNHIQTFNQLEKYRNENIQITCPLSYGHDKYREEVIKQGKAIFGDKFVCLLELLPKKEYHELLSKVDIYISHSNIQTGLHVINFFMRTGKKMFLKGNNLNHIKPLGIHVNEVKEIDKMNFADFSKPLSKIQRTKNMGIYDQSVKAKHRKRIDEWIEIYSH